MAIDAAVVTCDALDGVEDGVLTDPRACRYDARTLVCDKSGGAGVGGVHEIPCGISYCSDQGADPDSCGCGVCGSYGSCSHISCPPGIGEGEHMADSLYGAEITLSLSFIFQLP